MSNFSSYLNEYMKTHDINQKELADMLDISQTQMSIYVNGKREPSVRLQKRVMAFLKSDGNPPINEGTIERISRYHELISQNTDIEKLEKILSNESTKKLLNEYIDKLSEVI